MILWEIAAEGGAPGFWGLRLPSYPSKRSP